MATNVQFSIAVHMMAALGTRYGRSDVTSTQLASTVNTSPSFVRRILAKLSKAGLVSTTTGQSGACRLARAPEQINLLEIYRAVEAPKVFAIHEYPEQLACLVSNNIKRALGNVLEDAQDSTERTLARVNLREVVSDLSR